MGEAEEHDNKRPKGKEAGPTRSFDGSVVGPGRQIGPFRIEQEIGRGGAGVVYLAHDTKLDRSVAIKSLPPEVKDNPKALSRFTREARVLASLNHPNIATIHEVLEETEGLSYLVLEYIPGQTLAERIAKKPPKLEEALTIALQITEAVAAAHEHDVIHRDLKPGNIKITEEGKVKVLDFGLAKVVGGGSTDQQTTITEPGRVIGTPAYMSPEQARGQATDKRSDIWSFGCILYEMLTAIIPFKGDTISDTLANILQTEPKWEALPENVPTNIRSLLRHCLKKDPRRRLQHIGDAAIEISEALTQPMSVSVVSRSLRLAFWRAAALCALAGLVVCVIAMFMVMGESIQPSDSKPVRRFSITLNPENPLAPEPNGSYTIPTFTPDGRQLIYIAGTIGDTWLAARPLDSLEAQQIRGTEGASWPQVSPDGRWLAFSARSAIWKVPLAGGAPERITDNNLDYSFIWQDNNTLILSTKLPGVDGLSQFDLSTHDSKILTTPDAKLGHVVHCPTQFDPESGIVFFIAANREDIDTRILYALSLETGEIKSLLECESGWYVPSGHLVYVQKGRLMSVPFNVRTLQNTGPAVEVTETHMAMEKAATYAFSPQGTLVYVPAGGRHGSNQMLVLVDFEGHEETLMARPMKYSRLRVSSDTEHLRIAAELSDRGGIWIYDMVGATPIHRLTFPSDGICAYPVWMPPDNSEIIFLSFVSGRPLLKRKAANGSGEAEVLPVNWSGWRFLWPFDRTSDGKVLVARAIASEKTSTGVDIVAIDLERDGEVKPLLVSKYNEYSPALSPDGKWLAYVSNELGRNEVFVTSFPNLEGKWQVSTETEGGQEPVWTPNCKAIYYRDGASLIEVSVDTEGGFSTSHAKPLFDDIYVPKPSSRNYDIHPSGEQFLMIKEIQEDVPPTEFIVVENWFEELKRLAPTEKD